MPKGLKRYYGRGHQHFITFSCYRRLPLLGRARARNLFVKVLGEVRAQYEFALLGFVVMPEHVHLLIGEPKTGTPSIVLKSLKQRVSRRLRESGKRKKRPRGQLRLPLGPDGEELPRYWQRRFYDFNVWSEKKIREKLEYMHRNPVTRKLVKHPRDWPWSSWKYYETGENGLIRIDPAS
jgi:putative transposase